MAQIVALWVISVLARLKYGFATMSAAPRTPNWIERLVAFVVVFAALATGCSGSDVGREEGVPGVTKAGNLSVFKLLPGDCLGDLDKLTDQARSRAGRTLHRRAPH